MMTIEEIVQKLNAQAQRYEFGRLPEIRKDHLGLRRLPNRAPFGTKSTFPPDYAFHSGGHDELQFNVGFDTGDFRWGLGLSLKRTRAIPNPTETLRPTVEKLNEFIRIHRDDHLSGFFMWHHSEQGRSDDRLPGVIPSSLYREGIFFFLGRHEQVASFDVDAVLGDFDRLLPLYRFAQLGRSGFPILDEERGFTFNPKKLLDGSERRYRTEAWRSSGLSEVDLIHSRIQDHLEDELRSELGDVVASEHADGVGGFVDLVAKRGNELEFYEIKIGLTARSCIRQALGQLIEYGFWPGAALPGKLLVVGEPHLDNEARKYLEYLRDEFGLPIYYKQVVLA